MSDIAERVNELNRRLDLLRQQRARAEMELDAAKAAADQANARLQQLGVVDIEQGKRRLQELEEETERALRGAVEALERAKGSG